jgi:hypothetical protein
MRALGALILFSTGTLAATPPAEIALTERSTYNGDVTISVPQDFKVMSDDMLRVKYPNQIPPEIVYTDETGAVNLALSLTPQEISTDQMEEARQLIDKALKDAYPSATWYRSEVFERDGRRFFVLDVMTPAADTQVRNVILGTPFRGQLLVVTFNVSRELMPTWIETGQKMLASLKIRG